MAIRASQKGLYAFNLSIPPENIFIDNYIAVEVCFRCYKLDSHNAANCEKDRNYVICSVCSSTDHTYRNCRSAVKKCINCNGEHSTLAFSCPVRKKLIAEKRKLIPRSYASATDNVTNSVGGARSKVTLDNAGDHLLSIGPRLSDIVSKSTLCLLVASMKEAENKGSFQSVLDELLTRSGLSKFDMGCITPPLFTGSQMSLDSGSACGEFQRIISDDIISPAVDEPKQSGVPVVDQMLSAASSSSSLSSKSSTSSKPQKSAQSIVSAKSVLKSIQVSPKVSNGNDITIHKKRGVTGITADAIEELLSEKKIFIESNMDRMDCIRLLKLDIGIAKIVELPIQKFNAKLNAVTSNLDSNKRASIQQPSN